MVVVPNTLQFVKHHESTTSGDRSRPEIDDVVDGKSTIQLKAKAGHMKLLYTFLDKASRDYNNAERKGENARQEMSLRCSQLTRTLLLLSSPGTYKAHHYRSYEYIMMGDVY